MAVGGTGNQLSTRTLATIENYQKGPLVDQVTQGIGIWRYLSEQNLVEYKRLVGREEIVPLMIAKDSNGQDFDDLDIFSVGPTNELTEARVGHYNYRTGFHIGDIESMENEGNARNLSLLNVRLDTMAMQAKIDMAKRIVGLQGTNKKRGEGIRDVFGGAIVVGDETPVSSTLFSNAATFPSNLHGLACGDIDGEDYANLWGPVYKRITTLGNNNGNIEDLHIRMWLELQKWGGEPKVGICDQLFYNYYAKMRGAAANASLLSSALAYPTPIPGDRPGGRVTKFSPSLPDLYWNGNPIIFDPYIALPSTFTTGTDCHVNWIDPRHFKLCIDPRANWARLDPRKRAGSDAQWVDVYQLWIRYHIEVNKRNAHAIGVIDL